MNTISIPQRLASASSTADRSLKMIALFCCSGLAASLYLVALGVNLGLAWT